VCMQGRFAIGCFTVALTCAPDVSFVFASWTYCVGSRSERREQQTQEALSARSVLGRNLVPDEDIKWSLPTTRIERSPGSPQGGCETETKAVVNGRAGANAQDPRGRRPPSMRPGEGVPLGAGMVFHRSPWRWSKGAAARSRGRARGVYQARR
jgi:hypothetical protein